MPVKYTTKTGKQYFKPTIEECMAANDGVNSPGFCLACGEFCDGVEPYACRYECDCCGEEKVYGIEQLVLMGLVD